MSENVLLYFFFVGWLRCDIIIILVFFFNVNLIVGNVVWICVLEVILFFFIGIFKFLWINMCLLFKFKFVILMIDMDFFLVNDINIIFIYYWFIVIIVCVVLSIWLVKFYLLLYYINNFISCLWLICVWVLFMI